jgi:hypothetical protein
MATLVLDKGWLSGSAGAFVQLNAIVGLRMAARAAATGQAAGFNVDALVQGNWVTIATFDDEADASRRLADVLKELKNLFRYGS